MSALAIDVRRILPSQEDEMGRPRHTLPPVHRTDAKRPRWFFRAQIDVQLGPGLIERREKPYYLKYVDEMPRKRDAERIRDEICSTLNRRIEVIQCQTQFNVILDAFEQTYVEALKPNTRPSYSNAIRNYIRPAFGSFRLCDITVMEIQRWCNALPLAASSKKVTVSILASVFERAADWGYTTARNPAQRIVIPEGLPVQNRRAFRADEYLRIRASLPAPLDTMADVAAFLGLRLGEILGLQRGCLDYGAGTLEVRQNLSISGEMTTPKNGRRRVLPMGWLKADLLRLCPLSAPARRPVFELKRRTAEHQMDLALVAAGVSFAGAGWHCLRRMAATIGRRFLELEDVQEGLGHATAGMTLHYIDDPSHARREAAMERMRAAVFFSGEGGRA